MDPRRTQNPFVNAAEFVWPDFDEDLPAVGQYQHPIVGVSSPPRPVTALPQAIDPFFLTQSPRPPPFQIGEALRIWRGQHETRDPEVTVDTVGNSQEVDTRHEERESPTSTRTSSQHNDVYQPATNADVIWLEADEDPDVDTEDLSVPVLLPAGPPAGSSQRPKKRKAPTPSGHDDDDDNEDSEASYLSTPRAKRPRRLTQRLPSTSSLSSVPTSLSTSVYISPAPPVAPLPTLAPGPASISTPEPAVYQPSRGTAWSSGEEASAIAHMRNIMENAHMNGLRGEGRFREVSRRMQAQGYERGFGAVKNFWNRKGRAASGLDERRKKNNPLATSKQDKATKEARRQRKLGSTRPSEQTLQSRSYQTSSDEDTEDGHDRKGYIEDSKSAIKSGDGTNDLENDHREETDDDPQATVIECVCNGRTLDEDLLECANGALCVGAERYHLSCVILDDAPSSDGPWYCPFCVGPILT